MNNPEIETSEKAIYTQEQLSRIDLRNIPKHIAIVMDGNRRWAKREGKPIEMGHWYGAYLHDQLVGDLGIFFEQSIGRFQNVETHPDYRRQGICSTLVYECSKIAFETYGVQTLVMEADANYHAARIYESVGFQKTEVNHSLNWWANKP